MEQNTKELNEKIRKTIKEKVDKKLIKREDFKIPVIWISLLSLLLIQAFAIGMLVYRAAVKDESILWIIFLASLLLFQCKNILEAFESMVNREKCDSTIITLENVRIIQETTDEVIKNEESKLS